MSTRLFFRLLRRTTRGARLRWSFLLCSVALGVLVVVGVGALQESIEGGFYLHARELLGGDLAVESRRPLPALSPLLPARLRASARVDLSILPTMVRSEAGRSRLVELKAIDSTHGAYPLAGVLTLQPSAALAELLHDDTVLVAPSLLAELALKLGDTLYVGGQALRIAGLVLSEPDPLSFSLPLGPRVIITHEALLRSQLLGFGSRVRYRSLFVFPELSAHQLGEVQGELRKRIPGGEAYVTVETRNEAQPALRRTVERVQHYLGLVSLLSLLVASVGVAQGVSAWLNQSVLDTAILRCLGLRSREVFWLYLAQVALLALVGSLLGGLLGSLSPLLARGVEPLLFPAELVWAMPWRALGRGLLLGLLLPVALSLPPLLSVWRASPARVLRSEAAPLPSPRGLRPALFVLAAAALFVAAFLAGGSASTALVFVLGVSLLTGLCLLAARGLIWAVGKLPKRLLPALLWHGARSLARPAAGTVGSIVALALGTLVVLTVLLLESILDDALQTSLPERAPSVFLLDIQPDQWTEVEAVCRAFGATRVESVPMVMARLLAIDDEPVESLRKKRPGDLNSRNREQWVLTREQRISWMQTLPPDNQVVEGKLWSLAGVDEVSLERGFAEELGAKLGSVLRFDIQGVPVELTVSSLRTLEWRSFATNFFLVAEPGALDDAPHLRLGALRLPEAREQALQDTLSARFTNINMLRVRGLLERVQGTVQQATMAVRLLGGFSALTGLLLLTGSVAATQQRRAREAALWKALGLSRLRVTALFATEYALNGAVAGLLGAAGAYGLALTVARQLLLLASWPALSSCLLALLGTTLLSTVGGLLASVRALLVKPSEVLRG